MKKQLQILLMFLIVGMASTLAADYSGTSDTVSLSVSKKGY